MSDSQRAFSSRFNRYRSAAAPLLRSMVTIGLGEGIGRVFNLAIVVLMSRRFGVSTMGAFALGQTVSQYLIPGIDMGLRHIGARLIAQYPGQSGLIARHIQRKRLITTCVCVPLAVLYGFIGPVPADARAMVCLYSLSIAPYALSLDWLAWGSNRFILLSAWRSLGSLFYFAAAALGFLLFHAAPLYITAANGVGYLAACLCLWFFLRPSLKNTSHGVQSIEMNKETNWSSALWMGVALLFNQAFNSIDALVLGALSNTREVGLYNAAYRVLLLLLSIYYLATQAIYPRIAKVPLKKQNFRTIQKYLLPIGLAGIVISLLVLPWASSIISLIYGPQFATSSGLLRVLLFALPLDFVTSLLGITLVAWGKSKAMLIATASATVANVALNLVLIPRSGAMGAAWATIFAYFVLAVCSFVVLIRTGSERVEANKRRTNDGSVDERSDAGLVTSNRQ